VFTLQQKHSVITEVKKSRFLAFAAPVSSPEEAVEFFAEYRDGSATHNCWAYRVNMQYRFSDDGEPGGTAGRPILSAIDGLGFDMVAVLVVRFFGGIKLGTGGLARAYSGCASACLKSAPARELLEMADVEFTVPFDKIGTVYPLIERYKCEKTVEQFSEDGVLFRLKIIKTDAPLFKQDLTELTFGLISLKIIS
jgi:uncharacterized YigZ family protein